MKGFELGLLIGGCEVLFNYLVMIVIFPIRKILRQFHPIIGIFGLVCWLLPMIINIGYFERIFNDMPDMQRESVNDGFYRITLALMWGISGLCFGFGSIIKLAMKDDAENQ